MLLSSVKMMVAFPFVSEIKMGYPVAFSKRSDNYFAAGFWVSLSTKIFVLLENKNDPSVITMSDGFGTMEISVAATVFDVV